jgi:hypothetical protein
VIAVIPLSPAQRGRGIFVLNQSSSSKPKPQAPIKSAVKYPKMKSLVAIPAIKVLKLRIGGILALAISLVVARGNLPSQTFNEIMGRPTANSITMSMLCDRQADVYWEYGTSPGVYTISTPRFVAPADTPLVVGFAGLAPDTKYFYRTRYRTVGSAASFSAGPEHTFHTQRVPGSAFTFTIEADPHPYDKKGSHTLWSIALKNQLADAPDFILDLGDTFGDDHNPFTITSNEIRQLHLDGRPFFGLACHSSPLFFCLGNHEGESGYYLIQTPPNNLGVYGTLWRKFYYPNPVPDGFYSGNATAEGYGIGLPGNYYAWEWGDALFVVLDSYRGYTVNAKPRGWEWTLGKDQYDWLKRTLETSRAKFKFVFAHHTLGETRGAAVTAKLYEWGGSEADGRTWGFAANRPGWAMPIHQLMVRNGVNIFFQGHDHLFAREEVDGIVYQEVPMPSDSTYIIGLRDNGDAYTSVKMDGAGHLRVTVEPTSVKVDYVRAWLPGDENAARRNGEVAYSYAVKPTTTAAESEAALPRTITLEQNYPNPFNPSTAISFQLPAPSGAEGSAIGHTTLKVFDLLGREVATLVDQEMNMGTHLVNWNASTVPAGIYFYQLRANGFVETRKAVVLK